MSRYEELGAELDQVLDARRRISKDRYGFTAQAGREAEHDSLTQKAKEIRLEMRRLRYGTEE